MIDDYGHHPVEIGAVLAAAREGARDRVIAVVQPHRFTRLRDLMEDFAQAFNDADMVSWRRSMRRARRRSRGSMRARWSRG